MCWYDDRMDISLWDPFFFYLTKCLFRFRGKTISCVGHRFPFYFFHCLLRRLHVFRIFIDLFSIPRPYLLISAPVTLTWWKSTSCHILGYFWSISSQTQILIWPCSLAVLEQTYIIRRKPLAQVISLSSTQSEQIIPKQIENLVLLWCHLSIINLDLF